MQKLTSFPPVLPKKPAVLILGSMPGVKSLEKQQYYGNPRNHFWNILFTLFNEPLVENYENKLSFCKKHRIALWDTIATCYRQGSLDANIRDAVPNDIPSLLKKYPSIKLIACNGSKSYQLFVKYFKNAKISPVNVVKLPSTSPIPGRYTKTFHEKVEEWRIILRYIDEK
ncbi:DNA-deoxyinosine glycosylase [Cerasibacillus sp. JNUCC 74]